MVKINYCCNPILVKLTEYKSLIIGLFKCMCSFSNDIKKKHMQHFFFLVFTATFPTFSSLSNTFPPFLKSLGVGRGYNSISDCWQLNFKQNWLMHFYLFILLHGKVPSSKQQVSGVKHINNHNTKIALY